MTIKRAIEKSTYWFNAWQEACQRERSAVAEATMLNKMLESYRARVSVLEVKIRALMDETDIEDEGSPSRELRKEVWNAEDSEALGEVSGVWGK